MNLFKDEALEAAAHAAIRLDEPRALLDRFVTLIRESGTADSAVGAPELVGSVDVRRALLVPALQTTEGGRTLPFFPAR